MRYLFIILIFVFSGCSVTTPHIVEYKINPNIAIAKYSSKTCKSKSLKIMQSFSPRSLISKEMKYAQNSYQVSSFTESEWAQSPNQSINDALLKSIRSSNIFKNVSGYKSRSKNDFTLEITIEDFMQYFTHHNTKSFVNVTLYISLIDTKSAKIISSKRFNEKLNVIKLNANSGVKSLNTALSDIFIEINKWLVGNCK